MRILFVTATRVGDAVLSTGLLRYVIDQNPGARITIACGPAAAGLFGPGREQNYAPWGDQCRAVRGDLGYDEIFPANYDYRNSSQHRFMANLSVDRGNRRPCPFWPRFRQGWHHE